MEGGAAYTRRTGPEAWLEGGANLGGGFTSYLRGYAGLDDSGVLGGVRYTFDW